MDDETPKKCPATACASGDEVKIGPAIGGGAHLVVRHTADHECRPGIVVPVREGQPVMTGEIFHLKPKDPKNGIYEVDGTSVPPPVSSLGRPAKVANDAFRAGWDSTFGKQVVGQA
jgi:hypothetical protein